MRKQLLISWVILVLSWVMIWASLPAKGYAATPEEKAYKSAADLYNAGSTDLAREQFKKFLKDFPNSSQSPYIQFLIGECDYRQKKYETAIQNYRKGITDYPGNVYIDQMLYKLGRAYFLVKEYKSAEETFQEFIKNYPKSSQIQNASYWLGETLFKLKKYQQAAEMFETVIRQFPTYEFLDNTYYSLGWSYFNLQQYEQAMESFSQVLSKFPNSLLKVSAHTNLARCLFQLQRYEQAHQEYQKILSTYSAEESREALFWNAESLYHLQDYENAIQHYRQFLQAPSPEEYVDYVLYKIAWSLKNLGKIEEAIQQFQDLITRYPQSDLVASSLYQVALSYYNLSQWENAAKEFEKLYADDPTGKLAPEVLFRTATSYLNTGDYTKAETFYRLLQQKFPDNPLLKTKMNRVFDFLVLKSTDEKRIKESLITAGMKVELAEKLVSTLKLRGKSFKQDKTILLVGDQASIDSGNYLVAGETQLNGGETKSVLYIGEYKNGHLQRVDLSDSCIILFKNENISDFTMVKWDENGQRKYTAEYQTGKLQGSELYLDEFNVVLKYNSQGNLTQENLSTVLAGGKGYTCTELAGQGFTLKSRSTGREENFSMTGRRFFRDDIGGIVQEFDHQNEITFLIAKADNIEGHKINLLDITKERVATLTTKKGELLRITTKSGVLYDDVSQVVEKGSKDEETGDIRWMPSGECEKAISMFSRAVAGADTEVSAEAQFRLGECYAKLEEWDKAIAEYLKIVYLYPTHLSWVANAQFRAANIYEEMDKEEEALVLYQKLINTSQDKILVEKAQQRVKIMTPELPKNNQ